MYLDCQQVTPKQVSKSAKKIMRSAMEAAKITWLKTQRKKNKAKLRSAEATLPELPEPPAGTSTARRLQDPDHIDIVKAMVKVPSAQELGLGKKGEQLYDKMLTATTRGLNASTGGQYRRVWQRWLQWRAEYLKDGVEAGNTAPEVALYLTFLAYKSGGLASVRTALSALRFYTSLQGGEGAYMSDPLIGTVVKGLERDFSKPVKQKEGFSPDEIRKLIQHLLREKISPNVKDLRLACLLLLMYLAAARFEEAAGIELSNITTLETGNLLIKLRKGKKNQLAKNQDVILPKLDTSESKEMDITAQLKKYVEKLEVQEGTSKFLFPSFSTWKGKKVLGVRLLDKPITYDKARRSLLEAVKAAGIKIKNQEGVFGLHSFRVGALTAAANTGKFSNMQLQNMGRWAQLDSAARYFLPREKEKVGLELSNQLAKALKGQVLESADSRKAACNLEAGRIKAAATADEKNQGKIAKKRTKSLEKQEVVKKFDEKKDKKKRLLLRVKRTGAGKEDYELLPPKL